jgi:hypothetical protein
MIPREQIVTRMSEPGADYAANPITHALIVFNGGQPTVGFSTS